MNATMLHVILREARIASGRQQAAVAEECRPHLAAQPFTPDPRLTRRFKQ